MQQAGGVGLAAPQIGVGLRAFTFEVDEVVGHLVNPVLEFPDEEMQDGDEGCLSLPGIYFDTKRRMNVIAKGFNEFGDPLQVVGKGMLARCIQHETDHLDGVIFLDRLDTQLRKEALREIRKADWYDPGKTVIKVSPHSTASGSPFGLGR
jgi:peptide deformylase